ncbi:MAG: glycoside hydrolase family 36 protein [Bacteroidota bacterium]
MDNQHISVSPFDFKLLANESNEGISISLVSHEEDIYTYQFSFKPEEPRNPGPITLKWKIPYLNAKGVWKSDAIHNKRQQYDWELEELESRISVNAPVVSVFGMHDQNIITFAARDAINLVKMNALLREEDNHLYCHLTFFAEEKTLIEAYETEVRIDMREVLFSDALKGVSRWWEKDSKLTPAAIPPLASAPLYSTWYSFHQELEVDSLLEELAIAKDLGYDLVILDDGWQTHDSNRGYDFTGDWKPERIPDMAGFVENIHKLGMKAGLWFSVPFCGKKSLAYQKFKGKFLTESHRWAPVFDPRFPEVRAYLVQTYVDAVKNWDLDALKLDFIDDFNVYEETDMELGRGKDFLNVNEAVDALMTSVIEGVKAVKPEIVIEFRQRYIGPAMRKYGHMFRAFDCPNDPITNRIRITDVKLLCGHTVVHSDPITWHREDSVENAAIQMVNALFGVPQISIQLRNAKQDHLDMLAFFTSYWKKNRDVLLKGNFVPYNPLGNYPLLRSSYRGHEILISFDKIVAETTVANSLDVFNGSDTSGLLLRLGNDISKANMTVYDCMGNIYHQQKAPLKAGLYEFDIPVGGYLQLISSK